MLERTRRIGQAWAVSYFTDQLMTPFSKYFSGGSTMNGTPGGDRWARVLGGQIGLLSEPLHLIDADCCLGLSQPSVLYSWSKWKKNSTSPKTHHYIHSNRATATTTRRCAKNHAPHVSPYSPASIDTGFVCGNRPRTALKSVKTTKDAHTLTDIQTD